MKKLILLAAIPLFLTGCASSKSEDVLRDLLDNEANFNSDSEYSEYKALENNNMLDENGQYISGEDTTKAELAPVHVTFAENTLISLQYFTDQQLTVPVDTPCHLSPGDTIYVSSPVLSPDCDPLYCFDGFTLTDHSSKEPREIYSTNDMEIHIPDDYTGSELSVEPHGAYAERTLRFCSRLTGESENKSLGTWYADGKLVSGSSEFEGKDSVSVVFDYDPKEFYLVRVSPDPDPGYTESGKLTFSVTPHSPAEMTFDAELHRFVTAYVQDSDGRMAVKVSGSNYNFSGGDQNTMAGLKAGDIISVDVAEDYAVDSTQLMVGEPQKISGGWRYNITVGENAGDSVNISVFKADAEQMAVFRTPQTENCTASLCFDGEGNYEVKSGQKVDKSQKVILTLTPDEGYYFKGTETGKPVSINMDFGSFIRNIDSILLENQAKKLISTKLDTTDKYGEVRYTLDGAEVSGDVILREDQKLTMEYSLYDNEFEIARNNDSIISTVYNFFDSHIDSFGHMDNVKVEVPITADLDGKTITRESYVGLNIKGD